MNKNQYVFYGFDKIGFKFPSHEIKFREIKITFVKYGETNLNWSKVQGLIIPSGIFEQFQRNYQEVTVFHDEDLLLEIENRVFNLVKEKKWICVLATEKFRIKLGYDKKIHHTDLAKKLLNTFEVTTEPINNPFPIINTKYDQFRNYLKNYGVAKNSFEYDGSYSGVINIIAGEWRSMLAFEYSSSLFVLPYHSSNFESSDLVKLSKSILGSICDYIEVKSKELPEWVEDFKFKKEDNLIAEYNEFKKKLKETNTEISNWREYKLILTTTGENLRESVMKIFIQFFKLNINPIDELLEDFKIMDEENKNILAFCEVKGSKKGIKREYINQVDSHRERNEIDNTIAGLLIINNQMGINSIEKRLETIIPEEHIKHAQILNVLIIRTIDVLFLMKHFEDDSRLKFNNYLLKGGGWLKVNDDKIELIQK